MRRGGDGDRKTGVGCWRGIEYLVIVDSDWSGRRITKDSRRFVGRGEGLFEKVLC